MAKVDLAGMLSDARARAEAATPAEERGLAKFARLTRKDARVRPDQDAALSALAKALMRRRPTKTERITENTLIRVAIDLLLAHADELRGSTEDELRNSVTSGVRNTATPELRDSATSGSPDSVTCALPNSRPAERWASATTAIVEAESAAAASAAPPGVRSSRAANDRDRSATRSTGLEATVRAVSPRGIDR